MTQIDKGTVERLRAWLYAEDGTHWGQHEHDLNVVLDALDAAEAEKQQMERENQLQAEEIDKTRCRSDKWQSMVLDCEKYLKSGETPRQRMDRDHAESLALMKLYQAALERAEAAEARERAAVAAAYEKAADRAWKDSGPTLRKAIRALSDTDALAEYVEKVRADHAKIALSFITPDMHPDSLVKWVCEQIAAAIRQETNDT
jgi:hypothetical protein